MRNSLKLNCSAFLILKTFKYRIGQHTNANNSCPELPLPGEIGQLFLGHTLQVELGAGGGGYGSQKYNDYRNPLTFFIDLSPGDSIPFNSSPPGQNGHHFADDIFKCIFVIEKLFILRKISPKFVSKGPMNNNPALV